MAKITQLQVDSAASPLTSMGSPLKSPGTPKTDSPAPVDAAIDLARHDVTEQVRHDSLHISSYNNWSQNFLRLPFDMAGAIVSSSVNTTASLLDGALRRVSESFSYGPMTPSQNNLNYFKHLLLSATSYEQYHAAAHQLDRLEGHEQWKDDPVSPDYDYELITSRLTQLRRARELGDIPAMIFLLRTSLSRSIGDMGKAELYSKTRVGTKRLIEDYIDEVMRQLKLICESPEASINDDEILTIDGKLEFFLNTRQALGRTALLLSGGATLGLNHVGVVKSLFETRLLPRIISGSSIGSFIAALVCSKTDHELFSFLQDESINLNALEDPEEEGSLFFKISRFIKHGVIFDVEVLKSCIRTNIGDITFQEAYYRTRRILNVTVSSSTKYEMPRLLNYLTAPNVLIWSAVAASCSIPFIYKSAPLMARDKFGAIVPWNPSGHRWIDGSVENDLPMTRLSELFNVNHFIVCQVNPHVVPFLQSMKGLDKSSTLVSGAVFLVKSELQHRLAQLIELDIFPTTLYRIQNIISQKYTGDITIVPEVGPSDYLQLITNPSRETLWDAVIRGEKATWPNISIIRNHCQIELLIDELIYRLRCKKLDQAFAQMQNASTSRASVTSMQEREPEWSGTPLVRSLSVGKDMSKLKFAFTPQESPAVLIASTGALVMTPPLKRASDATDVRKGPEKRSSSPNLDVGSELEFVSGSEAIPSHNTKQHKKMALKQAKTIG